jgi:hypothetical protein
MKPIELINAKRQHLARLTNQKGASGEVSIIAQMNNWVSRPSGKALKTLLSALAETGVVIKGSSFDAIAVTSETEFDFNNGEVVRALLPTMIFIEIKTANQNRVVSGFSGFFFALTEGEIAASEALGSRHRVALYNKRTGDLLLTSVPEILERAKSTNWQVSIQL